MDRDRYDPLPKWKDRLLMSVSATVLVAVAGFLLWAHFSALGTCEQEVSSQAAYIEAQALWHQKQLAALREQVTEQSAARVAAERELGAALANRIPWHTKGEGPLDLPPLTMEQAKPKLMAYASEPQITEKTLVDPKPVSISQRLMQALGSETMKGIRLMGVRP